MNTPARPVEMLIAGVVFVVLAATGFYKAEIAYVQHTMIPFRSGSMSPAQASVASVLSLIFGLCCLVLWWQRRKK